MARSKETVISKFHCEPAFPGIRYEPSTRTYSLTWVDMESNRTIRQEFRTENDTEEGKEVAQLKAHRALVGMVFNNQDFLKKVNREDSIPSASPWWLTNETDDIDAILHPPQNYLKDNRELFRIDQGQCVTFHTLREWDKRLENAQENLRSVRLTGHRMYLHAEGYQPHSHSQHPSILPPSKGPNLVTSYYSSSIGAPGSTALTPHHFTPELGPYGHIQAGEGAATRPGQWLDDCTPYHQPSLPEASELAAGQAQPHRL